MAGEVSAIASTRRPDFLNCGLHPSHRPLMAPRGGWRLGRSNPSGGVTVINKDSNLAARTGAVLVMIRYEIDVGFAIGRLLPVFLESCSRLVGGAEGVHFSFGQVAGRSCPNLPKGFANILEFDYANPDAAALRRLSTYIRSNRIGTIVGLDLPVNASFLRVARTSGVRTVIAYWGAPMSSTNSGIKLLVKRLEVQYLHRNRPDQFIFESEAMRRMAVYGRGVAATDTAVVYTGVDALKFRPIGESATTAHDRFGIPSDRRIVVYMGHLHERKGVRVLMQAMRHIAQERQRRDIHALFLGNRDGEQDAFRQFWEPAAEFTTFGGYHLDVPSLMADCYAGCIPSTGWDSFPMSSLEMQACGLPVVVSDWQGVPETVQDGETGVVTPTGDPVALGDAVISLVDDPLRRARMSTAARKRIESAFTVGHQIENLVSVLQRNFDRG